MNHRFFSFFSNSFLNIWYSGSSPRRRVHSAMSSLKKSSVVPSSIADDNPFSHASVKHKSSRSSFLSSRSSSPHRSPSQSSKHSTISEIGGFICDPACLNSTNFLRIALSSVSFKVSDSLAFRAWITCFLLKKLSQAPQKHLMRSSSGLLERWEDFLEVDGDLSISTVTKADFIYW